MVRMIGDMPAGGTYPRFCVSGRRRVDCGAAVTQAGPPLALFSGRLQATARQGQQRQQVPANMPAAPISAARSSPARPWR
jgi:hypothetical protein